MSATNLYRTVMAQVVIEHAEHFALNALDNHFDFHVYDSIGGDPIGIITVHDKVVFNFDNGEKGYELGMKLSSEFAKALEAAGKKPRTHIFQPESEPQQAANFH